MNFRIVHGLYAIALICVLFIATVNASSYTQVKQLAQTIPQLQSQEFEISPLSGLTNQIYLLQTTQGKRYVLRIFGAEAESLGIDPVEQANIARMVGDLGVGPKVLYTSDDQKVMLIDYIPGQALQRQNYTTQVRDAVMQKLRKLHEKASYTKVYDPFKSAAGFRKVALHKSAETLELFPLQKMVEARLIILKIQSTITPHSQPYIRAAHNDLHCGNVIVNTATGNVAIIDLDYAGRTDLFFDLAIFANSLDLSSDEATQLLAAYFAPRQPTARDFAHLQIMRLVSLYWNSMWYFSQVNSSTIKHDHLQSAIQSLDEFLAIALEPRFQEWLGILS